MIYLFPILQRYDRKARKLIMSIAAIANSTYVLKNMTRRFQDWLRGKSRSENLYNYKERLIDIIPFKANIE